MHRDRAYLQDILLAAKMVLRYVRGKTFADFLEDTQLQDAVVRRLEIIGEAVGRLSNQARHAQPDLPWRDMVAMRNLLIHEYDGVDIALVWETVQKDLPALVSALGDILGPDDG